MDLKFIFRALRHRNFRLFFSGQSISLVGTWMQQLAVSWLVYKMTNSAFLLGLTGFTSQISTFFLAPIAGVIVDRQNRHRLIFITQISAMLQASVLAWLVLSGQIVFWHIVVLSFVSGVINAFDIPARQAFTIEMIDDKEDLNNAIALNSSMVNMARLVGPSIAGFLIVLLGEGACFLLNAVSYLAVMASLCAMRITPRKLPPENLDITGQLKEGFNYVRNSIPIRMLLLLLAVVSLVSGSYQVLLPVFAGELFAGGAKVLGFLMAGTGFGALTGAIYLASRKTVVGLVRISGLMSGLFGCCVIAFASSKLFIVSLTLAYVAGFAIMVQMAASNTILQVIVHEDMRGRVMSFYTMAFMGTAPLGSLLGGTLAGKIGVLHTLFWGGLCCIAGSLIFMRYYQVLRQAIRPIYIQKGIIPQVAQGIQSAAVIENLPR
ncbi:MAG: MFS transporter [Candidatus Omnitrophica bacterium]|nr:MFS transporter [Candidatus Omnitrophota bacterium]